MTDQVFKVKRRKLLQASVRAEAAVLLSALIHYRFYKIPVMNLISLMIIVIGTYYFFKRMFIRYSKDYRERVEDKEAKELFQTVGWLAIFIPWMFLVSIFIGTGLILYFFIRSWNKLLLDALAFVFVLVLRECVNVTFNGNNKICG